MFKAIWSCGLRAIAFPYSPKVTYIVYQYNIINYDIITISYVVPILDYF